MSNLFWHNLHFAFRQIKRLKSHTTISIFGLLIGLSSVFVIASWTIQELSYDKFHKDYQSLYMVTTDIRGLENSYNSFPETPPPLSEALQQQIPEIELSTHFIYLYGGRSVEFDKTSFKERGIAVDEQFLNVFNFGLVAGNAIAANDPTGILLTEDLASKLFPNQEAIGETITYKDKHELVVKGILRNIPTNSSLQFDFLVPYQIEADNPDEWWQLSDATFVKTTPSAEIQKVKSTAATIWRQHLTDDQYNINFVPIQDLRYKAEFEFFEANHGNSQKLYAFVLVAVLILSLSCLNYINLNSSYATKRTNEIMVRRVIGAGNRTMIEHFITESVVISIISWALAVLLSWSMLPFFQQILAVQIDMHYFYLSFAVGFFFTVLVVGIISGIYPAIMSSSMLSYNKNLFSFKRIAAQHRIRNIFLISQFALSISLAIACIVIIRQNSFMNQFEVGYQNDGIIEVSLYNEEKDLSKTSWKALIENPEIEHISFAGASPVNLSSIFTTESWRWEGLSDDTHTSFYRINVDQDYLKVFDIPLSAGRFFTGNKNDDRSVVINEKLQNALGFENPIGKILRRKKTEYEIIGVVRDFHFQHLSNEIKPLLFTFSNDKRRMFVSTKGDMHDALAILKNHHSSAGKTPLLYHYVSDRYFEMYATDRKISNGIVVFTLLTIILSSIGLFGMIIFKTEMKTKEIAIRKVHGASINSITLLLNKGILKWYAIAFLLSSLITWFVMKKWLENYAFRTDLNWWTFLMGALIILAITLLTVSIQTWKAAVKNPVESLKYE